MIQEEFKENRVFKYPEEYDIFDDEEEVACKLRENRSIKQKDWSQGKVLREKFKQMDGKEMYYEKQNMKEKRAQEREMERYIIEHVQ